MKAFKVLGHDVKLGGPNNVVNISKQKPRKSVINNKINIIQLLRQKEDILKWRNAIQFAESVLNPNRTELVRIYKDVILDAHMDSLITTAHLAIMAGEFWLEDKDGKKDDEATLKIQKKWFDEYAKHVIDALFHGYSLIEFGSIEDDEYTSINNVRREYIIPELMGVKKDLGSTKDLIPFNEPPLSDWTIFIWDKNSLGLLNKATPHVLWKKNVSVAWSEFAELFGMPIRLGKTNINNPDNRKNMENMLRNMSDAAWAVVDLEDDIELAQLSKTDAYQIYNVFIERANSEISKLILGQTMTTDDGSSRSQASVHKDIFDLRVKSWRNWFERQTNDQLIPQMERHGILSEGSDLRFKFDTSPSVQALFEKVEKLAQFYTIDPSFIQDNFGIPVGEKFGGTQVGSGPINAKQAAEIIASSATMSEIHELYSKITAKS